VASTDFKSDGPGLILGTVGSIPTHFRHKFAVLKEMSEPEEPFPHPVVLPVEDALDLHPFAPRDIPSVVESYLESAVQAGFREVRLIHGRGKGVQRDRVRSLLAAHPLVEAVAQAPPERGGWGATIVWLKAFEPSRGAV